MSAQLADIARNGVLRAAINTGNRALVRWDGESPEGVSPALARRLADRIGLRFEPVRYDGAGKVFADSGADVWDIAFLAIDPMRAERVSFTRPYHVIEATYAVRADSDISHPSDADRAGLVVLTSTGSAYDLFLRGNLAKARLEHADTPTDSFAAFRAGRGDVVAGVRASLERHFGGDEGFRILSTPLTSVRQAMVLPGPAHPARDVLDAFVAEAIADGLVAREIGN